MGPKETGPSDVKGRMGLRSLCRLAAICAIALSTASVAPAKPQAQPAAPAAPVVTRIHIEKNAHKMTLLGKDDVAIAAFKVAIGPGGTGRKNHEGDKVTPVGRYHVISRGPSQFKVFMRLDYPNADDRARFAKLKATGVEPKWTTIGGDIGIHGGTPPGYANGESNHDWTLGCISVEDEEIVKIAPLVKDGTIVDIED